MPRYSGVVHQYVHASGRRRDGVEDPVPIVRACYVRDDWPRPGRGRRFVARLLRRQGQLRQQETAKSRAVQQRVERARGYLDGRIARADLESLTGDVDTDR